ncbi:MAG TPA: septal ring lytic transglycosylase RlpA family protein, partial [Thermoanaerobaculia bacterium]|nr:septal ring lytic transglycosylase RlpA family protein [Thermoanaerobaculia bacterium]
MRPRLLVFIGLAAFAARCASRHVPAPVAPGQSPPGKTTSFFLQEGVASWYGGNDGFEGKPTASGEIYDSSQLTAAHRELPLGSIVEVTALETGRSVRVRINDRGPFVKGRMIDLSQEAARQIGLLGPGTGRVGLTLVALGA